MNLPRPNDKVGGYSLIGNWAGPGAAGTYKTRPITPLDFCAKNHDILFQINEISIKDAPYNNDPIKKSRLAKSNYIFWLLVNKIKARSISKIAIDIIGGALLTYDEKDFLPDDGFLNALSFESIQSPEYLMIPFQKLPQKCQDRLTKVIYDDSFDGVGASGAGKKWIYDYETAVDIDCLDFRKWAEEYFGEAWDKAFAVE